MFIHLIHSLIHRTTINVIGEERIPMKQIYFCLEFFLKLGNVFFNLLRLTVLYDGVLGSYVEGLLVECHPLLRGRLT